MLNQCNTTPQQRAQNEINALKLPSLKNSSQSGTCPSCGRDEGVQGVPTLFGRGKAQVCHDLRVQELREQLEVEEEDGDRQEEEVEEECAMDDHADGSVNALRT